MTRVAEQLGCPLDRTERVLDLVRQAGCHLAERRQAITLLHAPVLPRVLDHHPDLHGE